MATIWKFDVKIGTNEDAVLHEVLSSPVKRCIDCCGIVDPDTDNPIGARYGSNVKFLPDFPGRPFVQLRIAKEIMAVFPEFEIRPFLMLGNPGGFEAGDDCMAGKLHRSSVLPRNCPALCRIWAKKLFDIKMFGDVEQKSHCAKCGNMKFKVKQNRILKKEELEGFDFFGIRHTTFWTQGIYYCTERFREFILEKGYTGYTFEPYYEMED